MVITPKDSKMSDFRFIFPDDIEEDYKFLLQNIPETQIEAFNAIIQKICNYFVFRPVGTNNPTPSIISSFQSELTLPNHSFVHHAVNTKPIEDILDRVLNGEDTTEHQNPNINLNSYDKNSYSDSSQQISSFPKTPKLWFEFKVTGGQNKPKKSKNGGITEWCFNKDAMEVEMEITNVSSLSCIYVLVTINIEGSEETLLNISIEDSLEFVSKKIPKNKSSILSVTSSYQGNLKFQQFRLTPVVRGTLNNIKNKISASSNQQQEKEKPKKRKSN